MEMIRLRHLNGLLVPRIDHIAAREHAVALLTKAGFRRHQVSSNSTSVYYVHPQREPYLLRVGDHGTKHGMIGLHQTVARLTISPKDQYLTTWHVENLVAMAIGRYFITDPKPSRYYGKKGTWEDERHHATE